MALKRRFIVLGVFLSATSCAEAGTSVDPPTAGQAMDRLVCTASANARTATCVTPSPGAGGASRDIIGGPNGDRILLTSSNITVVADTFAFDVTITNCYYEWLGSDDGVTAHADGIRIFFSTPPFVTDTTNPGLPAFARVANADGQGTFTAANQDYFQYPGLLPRLEESDSSRWKIQFENMDRFDFEVMVSAATVGSGGAPCPRHDQGGGG